MATRKSVGFTLVELSIAIVIIAILASIVIIGYSKVQVGVRDSARSSRIALISSALERYYAKNGEYPGCAAMTQGGSQVSVLLGGLDPGVLVTPTAPVTTSNSITTCADLQPGAGGADVFAYTSNDSTATCTTGAACDTYTLEYRQESTGAIISVQGQHNATAPAVQAPAAPVVSAAMSGNNAVGTASAISCSVGTAQYQLRYASTNTATAGSWTGWTSWSSTQTTLTVPASQGYQYSFQAEAQCVSGTTASPTSPVSNTATTVAPISTPPPPTYLSPSQFSSNVNYPVYYAAPCPDGTSLTNGQYRVQAWTGGQWGPHPFGYLQSWENYGGVDHYVSFWGKYQCSTPYTTSPYSAESYNSIVVHPQ